MSALIHLRSLFIRDLNKLIKEINSYNNESSLWKIDHQITNSAGNLALHLVGNLNWFIGAHIANNGYIRQRELEFSQKNIPKSEMIRMIKETIDVVDDGLAQMDPKLLNAEYPLKVFKEAMTYLYFLIHLSTHLAYHLGQINYHRRLLDR